MLLGARPRGRKDFSPYEKVGPNLGCCTFQIEVMINAIHFWDLILFKFFLITTIGSWNIVLVVKMIIKWKKFQSLSPGQKGWKGRSGRNIRGIHSWTTDFSNSDLMINSTGSASEIWCRQFPQRTDEYMKSVKLMKDIITKSLIRRIPNFSQ